MLGRRTKPRMRITPEIRKRIAKAKFIASGGELKDSNVSLYIYSPELDVAKVTKLVGCRPSHAHAKGAIRRPPHGSGPAPIGLWCRDAPNGLRFEEKIRYVLDITTSRVATWRRLAKTHDVQLRCGIFMHAWCEGFHLPEQTMVALGARQWKLDVAIYSAEGEEIVDAFLAKGFRGRASRPDNAMNPSHSVVTALVQGSKRRAAGRARYRGR
jgi:hypothetical protein